MEFPPQTRRWFEYLNDVVKISLKLSKIFSGGKKESTIIRRRKDDFPGLSSAAQRTRIRHVALVEVHIFLGQVGGIHHRVCLAEI
jgi:hypothetical protein